MRVDRALVILTTRTNQFRDLTGHDHLKAIVRPVGKVVMRFIEFSLYIWKNHGVVYVWP